MHEEPLPPSNIVLYQTEKGNVTVSVIFEDKTFWLTQKAMAELFNTTPQNITIHLKNIFESKELEERATCKDFLQVQKEGPCTVQRNTDFYLSSKLWAARPG